MNTHALKIEIKDIYNNINNISVDNKSQNGNLMEKVHYTISLLDRGEIKVCEKINNEWIVNEWIKKAILLYFKLTESKPINAYSDCYWFDKVPSKFSNWTEKDFSNAKIRAVPGAFVRYGSYIGQNVIIMPSFVNIGANVGSGAMIDSFTTIGSCAQIGSKCHISSQVCIGGVLEPLQAKPVIIEDNCFIGTGSTITEGVIIEQNSVIASGVHITASTKIYIRETGEYITGYIPKNSVVVSGSYLTKNNLSIQCPVIIKNIDGKVKEKTSINELLRDE